MSDPSFIRARQVIQAAIADSSNNQFVDECLNQAQRKVARAHKWPELVVLGYFNTVDTYETGTVAVVDGDATVTLTGGTFPTDVVGMRFALSISSPPYLVRTRTDAAHVELAQPYVQDSDTSTAYILYKANYSLPSTIDRIEQMWLNNTGPVELCNAETDAMVTQFAHYPSGPGTPTHFMLIERDSSGNRQVLLGPCAPDDVYRVEFTARRKTVDNQFEGNLDDSRWPVIMSLAKSLAYEPEFYDRSIAEYKRYEALLTEEWGDESDVETKGVRVGQNRIDFPMYDPTADVWNRGIIGPTV